MRRWLAVALLALTATGAVSWQQAVPAWTGDVRQTLFDFEPNSTHAIRWTSSTGGSAWWNETASANGILDFETPPEATMVYVAESGVSAVPEDQAAEALGDLPFIVYNAQGQEVYRHSGDDVKWDGVGNDGQRVASGVYFFEVGTHRGKVVIVR